MWVNKINVPVPSTTNTIPSACEKIESFLCKIILENVLKNIPKNVFLHYIIF
jgi:hypothetical protein